MATPGTDIGAQVSAYNQLHGLSPFIAQANGQLELFATALNVPVADLSEYLEKANRDLPKDYLIGG